MCFKKSLVIGTFFFHCDRKGVKVRGNIRREIMAYFGKFYLDKEKDIIVTLDMHGDGL